MILTPASMPQDIYYQRQMEQGSALLLSRMLKAQSGGAPVAQGELVWAVPFQGKGYEPGSAKWRERQRLLKAIRENEDRVEAQRVSRDPCPRCNTRKDIGCKHFPLEVRS